MPTFGDALKNRALNASNAPSIANAADHDHRDGAAERVWTKTADWFCDTRHEQAKALLSDLTSDAADEEKKADSFLRLKELAAPGFENRFQVSSNYVERGEEYSLCLDGQEDGIRFIVQGDYLKKLKEWEDAAPPGESRTQVANQLQDAHLVKTQALSLSNNMITSLPELPASVQTLWIRNCNALISLPQKWPESVQTLRIAMCPALISLPKQWPGSLLKLDIENFDALASLPEQWPESLRELSIKTCRALTALPDSWPASLQKLNIENCDTLASLPKQWPASLRELSINGWDTLVLPDSWPESLLKLKVTSCDMLEPLPKQWPASLRTLRIAHCNALESIPESWPASLQTLRIDRCGFESLPAPWPASLHTLQIDTCRVLESLPESWPASLQTLQITRCRMLATLPGLWPASLQTVWIARCHALTLLPESWPNSLQNVYVRHCNSLGSLPERTPASMRNFVIENCPGLAGLGRPLLPAQDWWYMRARASQGDAERLRQAWGHVENEDDYPSFRALLERLSTQPLVSYVRSSDVVEVIKEVIESSVARAQILEQSQSAAQNCEDRPLTIFNTVQSIARFSRLQREQAPVTQLLGLAEGMLKTALLDEATIPVMRKQWEEGRRFGNNDRENPGPNLSEALEVQLELRRALGDDLGLPFTANSRYSEAMARLSDSDKQFVIRFVQARMADMDGRISGLISIPMWAFYVKQQCQAELEAVDDTFGELLLQLEDEIDQGQLTSQAYREKCDQLQVGREASINNILIQRTKELASGLDTLPSNESMLDERLV